MLTASGLAKAHGDRTLFRDVTFSVAPGRRIALVGGNGVGKTTLLEIVLGLQEPDAGEIHRPKDLRLGYLPQELDEDLDGPVLEVVLAGAGAVAELAHRLHGLETALAALPDDVAVAERDAVLAEYGDVQARFAQLGGYGLEAEAHRVLAGLGFAPGDAERPVRELSGGWRMRVALARLLLASPDVLVLDEPTNHLDVDSVAWLEQQLAAWTGALLFVSHDRDFIDAVANRIIELAGGTATEYVGGFAEFVVEREERLARAEAAAATQARQVAQVERFIERFRYKATKARQVQSRVKALDRLDRIAVPDRKELKARFAFPEPKRSSRVVAELEGVSAGYDDHVVLRDVSLVLERGTKLALIGPNGAGKTTLLRLLLGELEPLAGTLTRGATVEAARFTQHQAESLDPSRTVLEEFRTTFGDPSGRSIRTVLGSFGFGGDAAERRVAALSGGEATRLALAKVMCNPVSLLVLDEPTNHLDLPSCDLLEDALIAYPGTVVLVTHDRHLIRNAADALLVVRDGTARWIDGVDEAELGEGGAPAPSPAPAAARTAPGTGARPSATRRPDPTDRPSVSAKARRREEAERRNVRHRSTKDLRKALTKAERGWERAEAEVAELQRQLADPEIYADNEAVKALVARHDAAKDAAETAMAEWEALTTELEAAEARAAGS
ncbi:MAG: ABC-F family ATP-binding cassette domain-containing protein [Acidimicrobiales bacterium]|nr:ABC-F family ATP-binding cassette domain-containing protein [Acidimicrobiales bacterium]